jgi:hypothetical protein
LQNLNKINRLGALAQCTVFCAFLQDYIAGAGSGSATGWINRISSAISSPAIRISFETAADVRRVESYSTRIVRVAASRLTFLIPYTSRIPANAKATDSFGGAV